MVDKDTSRRGVPYTTCDRTGQNVPYSETVLEWTGLRVKKSWVDPRHPQDFVKVIKERQLLPGQKYITSTIPTDNFNDFILDDTGHYINADDNGLLQADLLIQNLN